jgi:hypothetical protein
VDVLAGTGEAKRVEHLAGRPLLQKGVTLVALLPQLVDVAAVAIEKSVATRAVTRQVPRVEWVRERKRAPLSFTAGTGGIAGVRLTSSCGKQSRRDADGPGHGAAIDDRGLRCKAIVAVVEATDFSGGDDAAAGGRVNGTRNRAVFR